MNVLYYFDATGRCTTKFECPSAAAMQARIEHDKPALYATSETNIDLRAARLVNGALQNLPQPGPLYTWDGSKWVEPTAAASLAAAKAAKLAQIKTDRNVAEVAPLTWGGSTFDADADAQRRIMVAMTYALSASAAKPPVTISMSWTLADGTTRNMSGDDLIALGSALAQRQNAIAVSATGRKNAVGQATTVTQVTAA